jgi:hypothetical protein
MDASPRVFCACCKQYYAASQFPQNRHGRPYKTCLQCKVAPPSLYFTFIANLLKARREAARPALAELDPNAPRQTRSGRRQPVTDGDENPRPRKRVRRTRAEIERDRNQPVIDAPAPVPPPPAPSPLGFRSRFWDLPAHDLGPMDEECQACGALHWIVESVTGSNQHFELCCKKGDTVLENLRPPPRFLEELLTADNPRARSFRQNIRAYNSALAFTSVSYTKDTRTDLSRGLHCFQIHGELFHYQGPLQPGSQDTPAFA